MSGEAEWGTRWGEHPYDHKTMAEIVHDYAVTRGDLSEQYARDQLVEVIGRHVAAERDRAVREALAPVRALAKEWAVGCSSRRQAAAALRPALPDEPEGTDT